MYHLRTSYIQCNKKTGKWLTGIRSNGLKVGGHLSSTGILSTGNLLRRVYDQRAFVDGQKRHGQNDDGLMSPFYKQVYVHSAPGVISIDPAFDCTRDSNSAASSTPRARMCLSMLVCILTGSLCAA